jgi:Xaa-Pro dipeptidase
MYKMELNLIRKACEITCEILQECFDNFTFETEMEVAKYLRRKAKERNVKLAFPPLVVSGKNFLEIHHKSDKTKLKGFVIVDFGVKYEGFCSDATRMLYIGKLKEEDKELFELVKEVQGKALEDLKVGKDYCDVDLNARINFGEYKKYFEHTLGHGIGKKVHQKPNVAIRSKDVIKEGDIVTIEPGIYTKKFGIRIEDTVLVKEKGVENLTPLKKDLIILD